MCEQVKQALAARFPADGLQWYPDGVNVHETLPWYAFPAAVQLGKASPAADMIDWASGFTLQHRSRTVKISDHNCCCASSLDRLNRLSTMIHRPMRSQHGYLLPSSFQINFWYRNGRRVEQHHLGEAEINLQLGCKGGRNALSSSLM